MEDGGIVWRENLIIADMDYVDRVAFDITVNFERMICRPIPKADLARWIDCIALDGGLRPAGSALSPVSSSQVALLHDQRRSSLDNFTPSRYDEDLTARAFSDSLGEFVLTSVATGGDTPPTIEVMLDIVASSFQHPEVRRVMIIPSSEDYAAVSRSLKGAPAEKIITLFAMEPMFSGSVRMEILGYSLMSALGIRADEIKE